MKRLPAILLSVALVLPLAACGGGNTEPTPEGGIYTPGTYSASAQGCFSEVKVTVTVDANAVTDVTIDASGETPELGGAAAETLAETIKAGGEVEAVAGATMTSNAVKTALDDCLAQAKGEAAMAETTPEPSEEPTETPEPSEEPTETPEPSEEPTETPEPSEEPTETPEPSEEPKESEKPVETAKPSEKPVETTKPTEKPVETAKPSEKPVETPAPTPAPTPTPEPTPEPTPTPAPKTYNAGTYSASAQGCFSEVTVTITVDDNNITGVTIDASGETPALGGAAAEQMAGAIKSSGTWDVDGMSGATMTSNAVKTAAKDALSQAKA